MNHPDDNEGLEETQISSGEESAPSTSDGTMEKTVVDASLSLMTPGESLGSFEIVSLVGKGGMGLVYRARDPQLDRFVALKVIRPEILDEAGRERFLREARASSRIQHPHVVTVYSAGQSRGYPWLAMEFIEGQPLSKVIAARPVEWRQALKWMIDLLDALEMLHQEGIVHRDLKPDNIMVDGNGEVKLMDFGLASLKAAPALTVPGAAMGTVYYMSPEQAMGQAADARSDVFAMGVILYEMLSGQRPFTGEQAMSVLYAIHNSPPPKLKLSSLSAPQVLEEILDRGLAKDPAQRYASGGPFAQALRGILENNAPKASKHPPLFWWISGIALSLAIVFAAVLLRPRDPTPNRPMAVQHNELAQDLEKQGKAVEAEAEYRLAILADNTYPLPWNNLAILAIAHGDSAEADSLLHQALRRDSHYAPAWFNLANLQWDQNDPRAAERGYRQAVDSDPGFGGAWNNMASLLLDEGRLAGADSALARGLDVDAGNPWLWRNLARLRERQGKLEGAAEAWRKVAASGEDSLVKEARQALDRLQP